MSIITFVLGLALILAGIGVLLPHDRTPEDWVVEVLDYYLELF